MTASLPLPPAVAEVFITDELLRRKAHAPDHLAEKLALQDLATQMTDHPSEVLPRLVSLAMELCDGDSAGVSVLDPGSPTFRWFSLVGTLAAFEGETTPRDNSPCGICVDHRSAILMENPERAYDWIRHANIVVPEVLLVPLFVKDEPLGTLWVVAKEKGRFDLSHARALLELSRFTGAALRMIRTEERLKKALDEQETLAREMSHRIKNLFAITDSLIRMTSRAAGSKEEFAETLSGRLHALSSAHGLVRRSFSDHENQGATLTDLLRTVLAPYGSRAARFENGREVELGDTAISSLALVFHELATNAAKHGALKNDKGTVDISWSESDGRLAIRWIEQGGPTVSPPVRKGFGSTLVEGTIARLGGAIGNEWLPGGVQATISIPVKQLR
ncbi:MAG: HWE histidine kinase domain-containing protein [Pseudorhodoplanes sp.]